MALAGGVAVCAGFVIVAGGFVPGAGLFVIVGACFVIGGRVAGQGRRQAVFIQRAGVFCEVNQGNFRRRGYELIILAVFVVQIGHAVIPRNAPAVNRGGAVFLFWGCYPGHNLQAKHPAGGVFGILC